MMLMGWILFMYNLLYGTLGKLFQRSSCLHSEYCSSPNINRQPAQRWQVLLTYFANCIQSIIPWAKPKEVPQANKAAYTEFGPHDAPLRSWTVSSFIQTSWNKDKQHMTGFHDHSQGCFFCCFFLLTVAWSSSEHVWCSGPGTLCLPPPCRS